MLLLPMDNPVEQQPMSCKIALPQSRRESLRPQHPHVHAGLPGPCGRHRALWGAAMRRAHLRSLDGRGRSAATQCVAPAMIRRLVRAGRDGHRPQRGLGRAFGPVPSAEAPSDAEETGWWRARSPPLLDRRGRSTHTYVRLRSELRLGLVRPRLHRSDGGSRTTGLPRGGACTAAPASGRSWRHMPRACTLARLDA